MAKTLEWPPYSGEMAELVRGHEWALTPLGPIEDWSERLKAAVEMVLASPLVSSVALTCDRLLIYNDAAARLYGTHHPGALGRPLRESFPDSYPVVAALYDRVFAGESVTILEQPLRVGTDGPSEVFDAYLTPVRSVDGGVLGAYMTGLEVGDRVRTEASLRESEALRRVALAGGRMGAWRWDLDAQLIWGDAPFWCIWGTTPSDDPRPLSFFNEHMSPESRATVGAVVTSAIQQGEEFDGPLEIVSGPHAGHWLQWRGRAGTDRKSMLYGVTFDITEQKQAEARLRESEDRQAFLLKLSDALNSLSDPIELQRVAMKILAAHLHLSRAFYFRVEHEEDDWVHVIDSEYASVPDLPSMVGRHHLRNFGGRFFEHLAQGTVLQVSDVTAMPGITATEAASFQAVGVAAFVNVPLRRNGDYTAGITAHDTAPRRWRAAEIELMREVGDRTWAAVERARAEAALRSSEEKLQTLMNTAPALIWQNDTAGENHFINESFLRYTGLSKEDIGSERWQALVHPDDALAYIASYLDAVNTASPWHHRSRIRRYDGQWHWFDNFARPLFDDKGSFLGHIGVSTDIQDAVAGEEALRESEVRFRLFVDNVREYAFVQTDFEGVITSWNPGAERLSGYSSAEVLGRSFVLLLPEEDRHEGIIAREMAAISRGERNIDAHTMQRKDGSRFWAEWITEPVLDDEGKLRGTAKVIRDETERQNATLFVRNALVEKEELLKEVHHRVKNNLQVITSMLNLQAASIEEDKTLAVFQEMRNRVQSIASIHEMLYRSASFTSISLTAYAKELLPSLIQFYGAQDRVQGQVLGAEDVSIELERAVPFGLVLNELISNALKHGFPDKGKGDLRVEIATDDSDTILRVSNTGRRLPPGFDVASSTTLGLRLVQILSRQLRGTFRTLDGAGAAFEVRFPASDRIDR